MLLMRLVHQVERKTEEMIVQDPSHTNDYLNWKNNKMHQLVAAQTLLTSQQMHEINIFDL